MAEGAPPRRKRSPVTWLSIGLAVAFVAAVIVVLVTRPDGEPEVVADPPSTPIPTDAPSASPSPSAQPTLIDGFAPVPQLPASAIPWDQVGPGWFAIDYSTSDPEDSLDNNAWLPTPAEHGGVSLLAPDGTWYAMADHADLGVGPALAWDGTSLWMARQAFVGDESVGFKTELANIQTGAFTQVPDPAAEQVAPFDTSRALDYSWIGDGLDNSVVGPDVERMGGCSQAGAGFWGWEADDMSFLYSPANGGQLVCFGPRSLERSADVTLVNVANVTQSKKINTFSHGAERYSFVGWIDANRFFFARTSERADPVLFTYDLRTDKITDTKLQIYNGVDGYQKTGFFDRPSQRHVVVTREYPSEDAGVLTFELYNVGGEKVGEISMDYLLVQEAGGGASYRVSGGKLVVQNTDAGTVDMFSLTDGSAIGHWDVGTERRVSVLDTPDR